MALDCEETQLCLYDSYRNVGSVLRRIPPY